MWFRFFEKHQQLLNWSFAWCIGCRSNISNIMLRLAIDCWCCSIWRKLFSNCYNFVTRLKKTRQKKPFYFIKIEFVKKSSLPWNRRSENLDWKYSSKLKAAIFLFCTKYQTSKINKLDSTACHCNSYRIKPQTQGFILKIVPLITFKYFKNYQCRNQLRLQWKRAINVSMAPSRLLSDNMMEWSYQA